MYVLCVYTYMYINTDIYVFLVWNGRYPGKTLLKTNYYVVFFDNALNFTILGF